MSTNSPALARLSDAALILEVKRLASEECQATARLIASLAEFDARRLYLGEGCSSLFTYCTTVLHLSEDAAYFRIEAARAAHRFPLVLERLAEGSLTLTAAKLLAPHLTADNHRVLLDAARHQSKRVVEEMIVRTHPRPDVPSSVRKLPGVKATASLANRVAQPLPVATGCQFDRAHGNACAATEPVAHTGPTSALAEAADVAERVTLSPSPESEAEPAPADAGAAHQAVDPSARAPFAAAFARASRGAVVAPLAVDRYKVQMTVSAETHAKFLRAQDLLRHSIPNGDPALVFDRALTVLIERLEKTRFAAGSSRTGPRVSARKRKGAQRADHQQTAGGFCKSQAPDGSGQASELGHHARSAARSTAASECAGDTGPSAQGTTVCGGASALSGNAEPAACNRDANDDRSSPKLVPERAERDGLHDSPLSARRQELSELPSYPKQSTTSRHIPAAVKREVWARDQGRCTFVGAEGRCGERAFLEFHHIVPYAAGGAATAKNVTLACRAHNGLEADRFFGRTAAKQGSGRRHG